MGDLKLPRTLASIFSALLIVISVASPSIAEIPKDSANFYLADTGFSSGEYSGIHIGPVVSGISHPAPCKNIGSKPCTIKEIKSQKRHVSAVAGLPMCVNESDSFCIQGLSIYKIGEQKVNASFMGYVNSAEVFAQKKYGLPAGKSSSIFESSAVENSSGDNKYIVSASSSLYWNRTTMKFSIETLDLQVLPVDLRANSRSLSVKSIVIQNKDGSIHSAPVVDFSSETRVQLKVRVPKSIGGWFEGRLKDAVFRVTERDSYQIISIDALPVTVPVFSVTVEKEKFTPLMKKYLNNGEFELGESVGYPTTQAEGILMVTQAAKLANDTASRLNTVWKVTTTAGWDPSLGNSKLNSCLRKTNSVQGVLTTDAMAYMGGAPILKAGYLNYEVAGLHFGPDGKSVTRGNYQLILRSKLARCIYGFSSAPITASVSVTNENGVKEYATSQVSETDGWLNIKANNFTFSKKVIKVKIMQ